MYQRTCWNPENGSAFSVHPRCISELTFKWIHVCAECMWALRNIAVCRLLRLEECLLGQMAFQQKERTSFVCSISSCLVAPLLHCPTKDCKERKYISWWWKQHPDRLSEILSEFDVSYQSITSPFFGCSAACWKGLLDHRMSVALFSVQSRILLGRMAKKQW